MFASDPAGLFVVKRLGRRSSSRLLLKVAAQHLSGAILPWTVLHADDDDEFVFPVFLPRNCLVARSSPANVRLASSGFRSDLA
jgi:hypothetical protein